MGKAIEESCRHLGIPKDASPFTEAEVGGDDNAGALIEFAQQMEEQCAARGAERQISQLVQDDQIEFGQTVGDLSRFAFCFFQLKGIDQFNSREETNLSTVMLDGLDTKSGRNVRLSGSRAADQYDVLGTIQELASMQLAHGGFIYLAGGEVKARDIFVCLESALPSCDRR